MREPLVTQRCNALIGLFQDNSSVSVYALRRHAIYVLFLHVLLPILIGGGIYSLWRSKTLLVFAWYRWAGLYESLLAFRSEVVGARHFIPGPLLYSLPDALWVYSFTALMQFVWFWQPRSGGRLFWALLPVSLAVGCEIGQFFRVIPGTFDWVDLAAYVAAWVTASASVNLLMRTTANAPATRSYQV